MYYLSIAAIFENENSWLDEWINYHVAVGVEHFRLYNHDRDTAVSDRILRPYVDQGIVENIHVYDHLTLREQSKPLMQPSAMKNAVERSCGKTRWLALIDLDEFILPRNCDDLRTLLAEYEDCSGLAVHWQQFGTSGHVKRPSTQINHLLHRAETNHWTSRQFKCIVKPDSIDVEGILHEKTRKFTPHIYPIHTGKIVNEQHREIQYDAILQPFTGEKVVINHYILRSFQDYWEVKVPRGRFNGMDDFPEHYWRDNDMNNVFDDEISRRFGRKVELAMK